MNHLGHPNTETSAEREQWFEELFDPDRRNGGWGGYIIGEHATGLLVDLQSVYCAGAWAACIVFAAAIIEAHLRETELPDNFDGGARAAFEVLGNTEETEWLRKRRNALVHFDTKKGPAITLEDHWIRRVELEADARRAVKLVADSLFANSWT